MGLTITQWLTVFVSIILATVQIWRIRHNHFKRSLDYPRLWWSLTWVLHVIIFYTATYLNNTNIVELEHMNYWSSLLRLHGTAVFVGIEVIEVYYSKRRGMHERSR